MAAKLETSALISSDADHPASPVYSNILVHSVTSSTRDNLAHTQNSCCGHHYRIQCIQSKGAILILLWGFLLHLAIPFDTAVHLLQISLDAIESDHKLKLPTYVSSILYRVLFILYPVMGWIADAKVGRFKAIVASIISIFTASVLMITGYLIHIYATSMALKIMVAIILGAGVLFNIGGFACFDANVIPFLTDQMLGASGENLSALIHWHFWFSAIAEIFNIILTNTSFVMRSQHVTLIALIVHFLCIFCVILSFLLKNWLDTIPQITNPIRLIASVLKYAYKTKYPQNRSALTYWEENTPSRIDLGKGKYGGPFSEEEVEDVKTSLRLLPIVFLSAGYGLMFSPLAYIFKLQQPAVTSKAAEIALHVVQNQGFQNAFLLLLFIVLFQFFIYPFFYNHIPSVLKRIGFGLLLTTLHLIYLTTLDSFANEHNEDAICLLRTNRSSIDVLPLEYYWALPAVTLGALSELFIVPFAIEFVIAQTPGPMKGLMVGLWFSFYGAIQLFGDNINYPFKKIPDSSIPSCMFYYQFTKTLISAVIFCLFVFLAYNYKMRTRDLPINFNLIAENHFNKYLPVQMRKEDQYVRDTSQISDADSDTSTSSCSSCQ